MRCARENLRAALGMDDGRSAGAVHRTKSFRVTFRLLARNAQRQAEFGVRVALGATRRDIVRLALVESGALALSGAAAGLALAVGGIQVLRMIAPTSEARRAAIALDGPVLLFAFGATVMVALLAGLPPAWAAMRTSTVAVIRGGGRGAIGSRTRHHLLRGLIITQIAVAFVLANVAALFSTSYLKLLEEDLRRWVSRWSRAATCGRRMARARSPASS